MTSHHQHIALFTIAAFLGTVLLTIVPADLAAAANASAAADIDAAVGCGTDSETGSIEKEGQDHRVLRKKHFPWFWLAVGAVAVGVAVYLLAKKKPEYRLIVEVDASVSGSPSAGASIHKKGQRVDYGYTANPGFSELKVTLDGSPVAAVGTIVMDRDHTLKASAKELSYTLSVSVGIGALGTPGTGTTSRRWGESVAYSYSAVEGYTNVKVKLDGTEVPAQGSVLMEADHALVVTAETQPELSLLDSVLGTWYINLTPVSGVPDVPLASTLVIFQAPPMFRVNWGAPYPYGGFGLGQISGSSIQFNGPFASYFGYPQVLGLHGAVSDYSPGIGFTTMSGTYQSFRPAGDGGGSSDLLIGSGTWVARRI